MKISTRQFALGLFLILGILLYSCNMPGVAPTQAPTEAPIEAVEPLEGTLMFWVDGSSLVFNGNAWIYQSEVTAYQFSLCVEAGSCEPAVSAGELMLQCNGLPSGESDASIECNGFLPAGGGEASIECNGFLPSDNSEILIECNGFLPFDNGETLIECNGFLPAGKREASIECNGFLPTGEGDASIECNGFLPAGEREVSIECNGFLPAGQLPSPDFDKSSLANLPVQIIGPDAKQEYCGWAGGRIATDAEIAAIGMDNDLPSAETAHGLKCAIDAPRPMAPACQTSATYVNWPPAETDDYSVTQVGEFCQNEQGNVTLDFNIPECSSIQSVSGNCDIVDDHRVVCYGVSGSSGEGEAQISVCDSALTPAEELQCPPGYEINEDAPATCTIIGPEQSRNDPLAGRISLVVYQPDERLQECESGQYRNRFSGLCEAIPTCTGGQVFDQEFAFCDCAADQYFNRTHGACEDVLPACDRGVDSIPSRPCCEAGVAFDRILGQCTFQPLTPLAPDCGRVQPGTHFDERTWSCVFSEPLAPPPDNFPLCPVGTYRDPISGECVRFLQPSNECQGGFHFDEAAQCCQTDLPSGNYPGCPPGQAYNPSTGACDSENIWGGGGMTHTVEFSYDLPFCSTKDNGGGNDCKLSADACAPLKFDPATCTCY